MAALMAYKKLIEALRGEAATGPEVELDGEPF
jgi:hypothetical protein